MKVIHLADVHFCKDHADEVLASLKCVEDCARNNSVDMIGIAGDLFDSAVLNSENARLYEFVEAIKRLGDTAPTAMVYGTPSHDVDGCLEIFKTVTCRYGITILDPGQAYFLTEVNGRGKIVQEVPGITGKALVLGIPEPRKKHLLSGISAGKDETEEAIRSAMHKFCFLLAAKRKEHADIPCFVLYHGEVAGTVYQNDLAVERGTGISITIDELADIGADYYALGHIHKPQQAGSLPAYYSGSIYPKNFGETHQASFKIVDVESTIENERLTSVNTVDFPHPQNMKIEIAGEKIGDKFLLPKELKGFRIWLDITCPKEMRTMVNAEKQLQHLIENGAVEGSRVTISDIPVETVRAAEITAVNTPAKKFKVWAENSNVDFAESHLKKIESLDVEIARGAAKAEGEWELVSIRLKGATGIMKGIRREEIKINFDNYPSGLIALTGANGKGKTTLIENCHPYPQLLTRKGKLQDHFDLKDSFREVILRNRVDGSMWKFLIQIDGQNKSGSCKYFIFKQSAGLAGMEWEPLPGVDGNLKPYEDAIAAAFGPVELFQRTAFITQRSTKNLPDLTDATAGEKKSLFAALAGIDYLQQFSDTAAEKAKHEAAKTHDADIKMQVLKSAIEKKPEEEHALKEAEVTLETKNAELVNTTQQGKASKAETERLQTEWNQEQVRRQHEAEIKAGVDGIGNEIQNLKLDIDLLVETSGNKANYEADIAEYDALQKVIESETAKKQEFTEARLKMQQEYAKEKAAYDEALKELEAGRDALRNHRTEYERQIANAESNIKFAVKDEEVERNRMLKLLEGRKVEIDRSILAAQSNIRLYERDAAEIAEDCPMCGQPLPGDKIAELKAKQQDCIQKIKLEESAIEKLRGEAGDISKKTIEAVKQAADQRDNKIAKEKAEIQDCTAQIEAINKDIEEIDLHISELAFDEPSNPNNDWYSDTKLREAQQKQQRINITQTRANLAQAQEAGVRIDGLQKQVEEKAKFLKLKEAEYAKVRQNPEAGAKIKSDLDAAIRLHSELQEKYAGIKAEIARTEATIEAAKKTIAGIAEKENEYSALKNESNAAVIEGQEWELVAKAFGKDGIQALELDALAPGISETANRILESAYGDRFRIEIRTTRMGGAGKKTKQIEDFLIYVIDSEDGEAVLLDDKSGGEAVWIKRAIYDAFAIIRKRNTNFAFLTCFQDETDGALDSAAKTAYCRMLEAAHAESKLRHTIIITHSNEVKAMIEQKIEMEGLTA